MDLKDEPLQANDDEHAKDNAIKSAEVRKYHVTSSLTGTSISILQQNPILIPSPNVVFNNAKRIALPYFEDSVKINSTYEHMMTCQLTDRSSIPLTLQSISCFLHHTCGVTSLKMAHLKDGGVLYPVRANPSSGGLHPTEVYLLLPPGVVDGGDDAVIAHYFHLDHALQIRARIKASIWNQQKIDKNTFVVCGASMYWREVWKYGVRGFRYSLLDAGHLIASTAVSARLLSWNAMVMQPNPEAYAALFGLNRTSDFTPQEIQDFQFAIAVGTTKVAIPTVDAIRALSSHASKFLWSNRALAVSTSYHDKELNQVVDIAACTTFQSRVLVSGEPEQASNFAKIASPISAKVLASNTILKRRSAQNFHSEKSKGGQLSKSAFYHMLERTVPTSPISQMWQFLSSQKTDAVWLTIYVHKVEGLQSGLYVLFRQNLSKSEGLGRALNFQNAINLPSRACEKTTVCQPPGCPTHLHLYQLISGPLTQYAAKISASQSLCGNCSFLVSMMADIPHELKIDSSRYRALHFEAGVVGQLLYLDATALGKGATGVGAYYDDAANSIFSGNAKTLYHFAVGQPTTDDRITIPVDKLIKTSFTVPVSSTVAVTSCVCGKNAPLICAKCKVGRYCSLACQKSHWSIHKKNCVTPPVSYSAASDLLAEFTPKNQLVMKAAQDRTSRVYRAPEYTPKFAVNRQDLPEFDPPEAVEGAAFAMATAFKAGLFEAKKDSPHISPEHLFRFASLQPVPESTRETGKVPVEYFLHLQAMMCPNGESMKAESGQAAMTYMQAQMRLVKLGVSMDPAYAKPPPSNPTPKQILARYKELYDILVLLTFACTLRLDGWEYYSSRAEVFNAMNEFDLAWQDCVRSVSLVESGFTSAPPPSKFEYQYVLWTKQLAEELEWKIGMHSVQVISSFEDLEEMLFGSAHNITDSSLASASASEVYRTEKDWDLNILNGSTAEFLRVLDNIPRITTGVNGCQRVWEKFPTIMKNNYLNFTSHPTDRSDPRIAAWKDTLCWLEDQHIIHAWQPLTIDFLMELNRRCLANDEDANNHEREVWASGRSSGIVEATPAVPGQFRDFYGWMRSFDAGLSSHDHGLLSEIQEKFESMSITPKNFNNVFSAEDQKLITRCYNQLTPPSQILYEMKKLIDMANSESFRKLHPVQRAAILGLRLVCIHPFHDGNGRTQQLLMGIELMRAGYPPYVRREIGSYATYLTHSIRELDQDHNCEVFTRWSAVNVALAMIGSDASKVQLKSYAEKLFVRKLPFDPDWSAGNKNLAPPAELHAYAVTAPNDEPTNNFIEHWVYAHSPKYVHPQGDSNALPRVANNITISEVDEIAEKNGILAGKWVLHVREEHINNVWKRIAKAISSNELSPCFSAKSSTALDFGVPPDFHAHYIVCVYTGNYLDDDDVMRGAGSLKNLLLNSNLTADILAMHYKPDIYTHLGVYGKAFPAISEWRYSFDLNV